VTDKSQLSFAEKWDIEEVSPRVAKGLVKAGFLAREPVVFMGPTGAGKTAIIRQAARELAVDCANDLLHIVPQTEEAWDAAKATDDPAVEQLYREIHKEWLDKGMVSSNTSFEHTVIEPSAIDAFDLAGVPGVDKETKRQFYYRPELLPHNNHALGIWQITEMNRPAGRRTLKPLLNAFQRRVVGQHVLPPGISIVADVNEGEIYDVEDIKDPFFIRRVSWVWVNNSLEEWLAWMEENYASDLVRCYVLENPDSFDDDQRRQSCKPYACPAVWTKIQQNLDVWLKAGLTVMDIAPLIAGRIGKGKSDDFVAYVQKGVELSPTKILTDYPTVRERILELIHRGRGADRVSAAALSCVRFLLRQDPNLSELDGMVECFISFFKDLPLDTAQNVAMEFASEKVPGDRKTEINAKTRLRIISHLMRDKECTDRLARFHATTGTYQSG